jgi:hypothetical protein
VLGGKAHTSSRARVEDYPAQGRNWFVLEEEPVSLLKGVDEKLPRSAFSGPAFLIHVGVAQPSQGCGNLYTYITFS